VGTEAAGPAGPEADLALLDEEELALVKLAAAIPADRGEARRRRSEPHRGRCLPPRSGGCVPRAVEQGQ
jgi:hypothetical protein